MEETIFKGYLDLKTIESKYQIRVDHLRKICRNGELKSIQVGGSKGPHLVKEEDIENYVSGKRRERKESILDSIDHIHSFMAQIKGDKKTERIMFDQLEAIGSYIDKHA